jgi:hypothetical protein
MKVKAMTINGITIPERMVTMQPPRILPDDLIEIIRQESDRRAIRASSSKKDKKDAAFAVSTKPRSGKGRKVKCFNCGKTGHIKADCWAEGGGKAGQGPKGKAPAKDEKAVAASDDVAWMSVELLSEDELEEDPFKGLFDDSVQSNSKSNDIPALLAMSSDSSDSSDDDLPALVTIEEDEEEKDDDGEYVPYCRPAEEYCAVAAEDKGSSQVVIELYDSGASCHMSHN